MKKDKTKENNVLTFKVSKPVVGPSNENEIQGFMHCQLCLAEVMKSQGRASPRDYARISVGYTSLGWQVWCNRHDCNIVHISFEGCTHPANLTRKDKNENAQPLSTNDTH